MIAELIGNFITDDISNSNKQINFEGVLSFRMLNVAYPKLKIINGEPNNIINECSAFSKNEIILVIMLDSLKPKLNNILPFKIRGMFLLNTLKKIRVFEAIEISQPILLHANSELNFHCNDDSLSHLDLNEQSNLKLYIIGTIYLISQIFKLKTGLIVYIFIRNQENQESVVLLMNKDIQAFPYLSCGDIIKFHKLRRINWKNSNSIAINVNYTHNTEYHDHNCYLVDRLSQLEILGSRFNRYEYGIMDGDMDDLYSIIPTNECIHNDKNFFDDNNYHINKRICNTYMPLFTTNEFLYPANLLNKETLSTLECIVEGEVQQVHRFGWIELLSVKINILIVSHNRTDVRLNDPAPVQSRIDINRCYLYIPNLASHLRHSAIGISIRKGAVIIAYNVLPIYLWTKFKGFAFTVRSQIGIKSFSCIRSIHDNNNNNIDHCAISISVPFVIKNSCLLYTAWRAEIHHIVYECTGLYLCNKILSYIESYASFPFIDRSNFKQDDHYVIGDGHISSQLIHYNHEAILNLHKHVQLSSEDTAIFPFGQYEKVFDINYIYLYIIRNGYDIDWICNHLPQIWSIHTVAKKIKRDMNANFTKLGSNILERNTLFQTFHIDLCSKSLSSNKNIKVNALVISSVQYVCLPTYDDDGDNSNSSSHYSQKHKTSTFIGPHAHAIIEFGMKDHSTKTDMILYVFNFSETYLKELKESVKSMVHANHLCTCTRPNNNNSILYKKYCFECNLVNSSNPLPILLSHQPYCCVESSPSSDSYHSFLTSEANQTKFILTTSLSRKDTTTNNTTTNNNTDNLHSDMNTNNNDMKDSQDSVRSAYIDQLDMKMIQSNPLVLVEDCSTNACETFPTSQWDCVLTTTTTANNTQSNYYHYPSSYCCSIRDVLQTKIHEFDNTNKNNNTSSSNSNIKLISMLVGLIVKKQQLLVDFLEDEKQPDCNNNNYSNNNAINIKATHKRKKYEQTNNNDINNNRKCSITVRDILYPDTINIYITNSDLNQLSHHKLVVGSVVLFRNIGLCLPALKKKLYLKIIDAWKPSLDLIGLYTGSLLHELCISSRTMSDPWTICNTSDLFHSPVSLTTIHILSTNYASNRAIWNIKGNVAFVRRISITLRCNKCQIKAKPHPNRLKCGFQCTRCLSQHNLIPFWDASIAFDDGTGECNLVVEGADLVFPLIRARYDETSIVLHDICGLVEQHVERYGMLIYNAFEKRLDASHHHKPYQWQVKEHLENVNTAIQFPSITTATPTISTSDIFDIYLTEQNKKIISYIDLKQNPTNINPLHFLKAYLQLGSFTNHFEIIGRIDISQMLASETNAAKKTNPLATTAYDEMNENNKLSIKKDIKVQKNNDDRPYLAFYELKPTEMSLKLSFQVHEIQEIYSEKLRLRAYELVNKLNTTY